MRDPSVFHLMSQLHHPSWNLKLQKIILLMCSIKPGWYSKTNSVTLYLSSHMNPARSRRWFRHLPVLYMHSAFFGPMEWRMQTYRQCSEQRRYPNSCMHPPPGGDSPMLIKGTALKVSFGKLPGHDSTLRDLPLSRSCVRQLMWRCSTAL